MKLFRRGESLQSMNVLIMGLGTKDGGVGAALFANRQGAKVTVTDLQNKSALKEALAELKDLNIKFVLGTHRESDFTTADLVIRNPGIKRSNRYLAAAAEAGVPVESPIGIFCEKRETHWTGITGTKGKSFTTHLVSHILQTAGIKTVAAGNNCVSPLRFVDDKPIYPVLELSSWQLAEMDLHERSPHIGCWLNFFPDHMNWYDSMEDYRFDKESIVRHQREEDIIILPLDDSALSTIPGISKRYFFSSTRSLGNNTGSFIQNGWIIWKEDEATQIIHRDSLPEHMAIPLHLDLIPPAVCCAVAAGVDKHKIAEGIASFPGIPHRFQFAGKRGRITFINDSAATTPDSVVKAITSLNRKNLVLIAGGGGHKNLDYRPLAELIAEKVHCTILFKDDPASIRLRKELENTKPERLKTATDMQEAVDIGMSCLNPEEEGTLLLSPGCSGAPFFVDLFQRGEQFLKYIRTGEL